jgi:2-methylcitrate dehydratase
LWKKIKTVEDPKWTERYHSSDPKVKAFGGKVEIRFNDGSTLVDEKAVANAHTLGATPWKRPDYIRKFKILTEGVIDPAEQQRFLDLVQRLPDLSAAELLGLTVALPAGKLLSAVADKKGIF